MELLTPGSGLIIWQAIIFLMLFVLLSKFAWKPILGSLKEREDSIQNALDTAEKARAEMAKLTSDNEKLLKEAREERDKMLKDAREVARIGVDHGASPSVEQSRGFFRQYHRLPTAD